MNQIAQIMQTAIYTGFGAVVLWTYFGLFLPGRMESGGYSAGFRFWRGSLSGGFWQRQGDRHHIW